MIKLKIKETYLLLLIVLSLVSLGIYTTYALFTTTTTINDVVGITASLDIGKSITEYEVVNIEPNDTKIIELNIVNSYEGTIYYGAWYKIAEGNSEDVDIGLYTEKNSNTSSGSLASNGTKQLLVGITNNGNSTVTVYLGVKGNNTNELNLGSDKTLLPSGWSTALLVTDEVLEEHKVVTTTTEAVNKTFSTTGKNEVTLDAGTYKLEVWGAQGGSYNETYAAGGKGGYSYGTLTLTETTNLYVYVGGKGGYTNDSTHGGGGTNGGGHAPKRGGGGGGATDIRINNDSLYARVIVAGGGGGAYSYSSTYKANGGAGGGTSGIDGSYYVNGSISRKGYKGKGGTQTTGGSSGTVVTSGDYNGFDGTFGNGGSAGNFPNYTLHSNGAGGGGWYGGGGSDNDSLPDEEDGGGGGGGSGYVYTSSTASNYPSGCLLNSIYYLTNAKTIAGNTSFTDYNGSTVTGHSGDGYAKITGNKNTTNISYTVPQLKGLTPLNIAVGQNVDLTNNLELICENNQTTGCTITSVSITDTSTLSTGTYTITYKVTGVDNTKYLFNRTINVL